MPKEHRLELKEFLDQRVIVQGRITKFGYRSGDTVTPHLCISDAYIILVDDISKNIQVDHFWIKFTKRVSLANPSQNDYVSFTATVGSYLSVEGVKYAPNTNIRYFKIVDKLKFHSNKKRNKKR